MADTIKIRKDDIPQKVEALKTVLNGIRKYRSYYKKKFEQKIDHVVNFDLANERLRLLNKEYGYKGGGSYLFGSAHDVVSSIDSPSYSFYDVDFKTIKLEKTCLPQPRTDLYKNQEDIINRYIEQLEKSDSDFEDDFEFAMIDGGIDSLLTEPTQYDFLDKMIDRSVDQVDELKRCIKKIDELYFQNGGETKGDILTKKSEANKTPPSGVVTLTTAPTKKDIQEMAERVTGVEVKTKPKPQPKSVTPQPEQNTESEFLTTIGLLIGGMMAFLVLVILVLLASN